MKEINIAKADIKAVAAEIVKFASDLSSPEDLVNSKPPAVRVIDCVPSLNRRYDTFVVPRLETFMSNHPEIQQVTELAEFMASYPTPHAFVQQELDYNFSRAHSVALSEHSIPLQSRRLHRCLRRL